MMVAALFALPIFLAVSGVTQETTAPIIVHEPAECFEVGSFPRLCARVTTEGALGQARVYFRASRTTKWYFVIPNEEKDEFCAALPSPLGETPEVEYYMEVIDEEFQSAITPTIEAQVVSDGSCSVSVYASVGAIPVFSGITSALEAPAGFAPTSLAASGSASGAASGAGAAASGGGGLSGATIAAIVGAAGAAAAAGVVVTAGSSNLPVPTSDTGSSSTSGSSGAGSTSGSGAGGVPTGEIITQTVAAMDLPRNLPDPGSLVSMINFPTSGTIIAMELVFEVTHQCERNLLASLRSPEGRVISVMDRGNLTCTEVLGTIRSVNTQVGEVGFFGGGEAGGLWTFTMQDDTPDGNSGRLEAWRLTISSQQ